MSSIELATVGLVDNMEALASAIGSASAEEAKGAYDRLGVAREWAKLQQDAAALAERLVWVEALILRRIGQLDPRALPGARRPAARHYATLSDADLSSLLNNFPARSAIAAYNLWAKAQGIRRAHNRGRALAFGHCEAYADDDPDVPSAMRYAIAERVTTVRQAAAVIVDEYARRDVTTVSDVVDQFIAEELPIADTSSPLEVTAFRVGLTTAVREAFASAPVQTTERSWEIPAFITVADAEAGQWFRIPSEFATVSQARQMLALRRGQVESLQRSVDALAGVLEGRYQISERDPDEWLREDQTAHARRATYSAKAS